jgi:predicted RNA-binding protein
LPALQNLPERDMSNESSLSKAELNDRIRILEDNIRQLIEQAAAASGEQNESRIADRLSQQNEELEKLTRERDARLKK